MSLAALFAVTSPAAAVPNGTYRGETASELKVKIVVEKNRIKRFVGSVHASCYTGDRTERFVYPPPDRGRATGRIKSGGSFAIVFKGNPDVSFSDDKRTLKGRFDGGRVAGTLKIRGLCSADVSYAAKRG